MKNLICLLSFVLAFFIITPICGAATYVTKQITNDDSGPINVNFVQFNASGHFAWCADNESGTGSEIFLYNGTEIIRITDDAFHNLYPWNDVNLNPSINDNGEVVWASPDGIFLYNGATIEQITGDSSATPQINSSGTIVWQGPGGVNDGSDIYYYDGTNITHIDTPDFNDWYPQINENGQVAWFGDDGKDWEIFLYDGTNTTRITRSRATS